MFSLKHMTQDDMQKIMTNLQTAVLKSEDGSNLGVWILTMIDHWNNDHERIVLLQEMAIYIIKYDITGGKMVDLKHVPLRDLRQFQVGQIVYPQKSLIPLVNARNCSGLRLVWGDMEKVKLTQKWNPVCKSIPSAVFVHHPLYYQLADSFDTAGKVERTSYDVDGFILELKRLVTDAPEIQIKNDPINIESYGNVSSLLFNNTNMGYAKNSNGLPIPPIPLINK